MPHDAARTSQPGPRAALVVGTWPTRSQTFVERHARHLFGGNTCILANSRLDGNGAPDRPVFDRSAFRRQPVERLRHAAGRTRNALLFGTGTIPTGAERHAIATFLRDQKVDVILSEFGTKAIIVADIAETMGIPCFTYFRGSDASRELNRARRRKSYAHVLPRLSGIVAVSRHLIDNLAARGLSHPNAHVIPSGVDVRRFAPGDKVPASFVAVGRMVEKKAPEITLRAFAEATRDRPGARLRFIGDGPLLSPMRTLARDLGVADRVVFEGGRSHDAVRRTLATTETFIQHSVTAADGNSEGLPTAIQEAMACGCVTIATRHAGIPEAIDHGETGWLGSERDQAGFARLVRESLDADRVAMGRAARRVACERFDNDKLLARLEAVLQGARE